MTAALVASLLRALVVGVAAAALAVPVARLRHRIVFAILWVVWLVPPLVWAYWLAPSVSVWPVPLREAVGAGVLALRHVAPAALVLAFLPAPPLDDAARFIARRTPAARGLRAWLYGAGRNPMLAAGAVFLLAFQEFELASLLRLRSWTVVVFDGYAAGLGFADLAPWVGAAVALQAAVAGWLWRMARRIGWGEPGRAGRSHRATAAGGPVPGLVLGRALVVALSAAASVPLLALLANLGAGLEAVWDQGTLRRELLASAVMAFVAVTLATALLRVPRTALTVLVLPALSGGLALGIGLASAFAWLESAGMPLLDTPVPLVLGWALWLLPLALVLDAARPRSSAWHCARVLAGGTAGQRRAGRALQWHLSGRYRLAAAGLLFGWLQGEVLLAAVLAPTAATPAALRLYNLMHYGQSTVLAGMVACVVVVAALPLWAAWLCLRGGGRG